ncbi:MAG: V-type ATP synthase subunit F [Oscillospiraceae bacterium]|jgi:V/A-type H+-transporting ATPase subunit F|nr:V-type ATP synthase subunit F [Oscillospiraceae bacterium]
MRSYVISDNLDSLTGMRLAGCEGEIAHTAEEARQALVKALRTEGIAVVCLTEKLAGLIEEDVTRWKERGTAPLLTVIPDRHGSADMTASISRYLAETVGIHI